MIHPLPILCRNLFPPPIQFRKTLLLMLVIAGYSSAVSASDNRLPESITDSVSIQASICAGDVYLFGTESLDTAGTYVHTFTASDGTDSTVTLLLHVWPVKKTNLTVNLCDGTSYIFKGDTLTVGGIYTDSLSTTHGCDSIVVLHLNFVPFFDTQISAQICGNQSYTFAGQILTQSGMYMDSLKAIGGCDSTVILNLVVNPVQPPTDLNETICGNEYYLFHGDTLELSGTYMVTLSDLHGCDSVIVLHLTVFPVSETHLTAAICKGTAFDFNGQSLTDEGTYTALLTAANGCDSTVTLLLSVHPSYFTSLSASVCGQSYSFGGQILTQSGVYTDSLKTLEGCDSIVVLDLLLYPIQPPVVLNATICGNQHYFFNGDSLNLGGMYMAVLPDVHGCDSTTVLNLTVLPTSSTVLTASICKGTPYEFNGQSLTESGTYVALLTSANGCDSTVTLDLTVRPTHVTTLTQSICDGQNYNFNGQPLTATGVYSDTLVSANGCDSLVFLYLYVLPVVSTHLSATICANETYTFLGTELHTSGTYMDILPSQNGCDSTVTLTLTVLPVAVTSTNAIICSGQTIDFNGSVLGAPGDYTVHLTAYNGCDSAVTLHLAVLESPSTEIQASICAGGTYAYNGASLDATGIYHFTYTAANGCDSVVTLSLQVLPVPVTHRSITLCNGSSLEFAGQMLTTDGIYTDTLTAFNGCDSIDVLDLKFVPYFTNQLQASICANETYPFAGMLLQQSGVYVDTLKAEGGCDSILVLTLQVLPLQSTSIDATICSNGAYNFNGQILTDAGIYAATLAGSNGCDSVVTLHLSVLPVSASFMEATICDNELYPFNGNDLDASGIYTEVLPASNGCDSTVTLTLTVLPTYHSQVDATICSYDTYDFYGMMLNVQGTYQRVLTASTGCDSIITLNLSVIPKLVTQMSATICDGDSYPYNNGFLTMTGVYTFGFTASTGCDSFVTVVLTVLPKASSSQAETICQGDSIVFDNQLLTVSGIYSAVYTSANGCDSTVTLTLLVNTIQTGVTQQGGTLTADAQNATYQWVDCNSSQPVAGATETTYTPQVTGNYAVAVTQNGCQAVSDCIFVEVVAVGEPEEKYDWLLQPNPASDHFWVTIHKAPSAVSGLEVYDMTGRLLLRQELSNGYGPVRVDLNGIPDGILLVKLSDGRHAASKKLIKISE
jgi:hypothetical protein